MGSDGPLTCCQVVDRAEDKYRRRCGCLKTSDKLKELLRQFPPPPPPSPRAPHPHKLKSTCLSAFCNHSHTFGSDNQDKSNCAALCPNKNCRENGDGVDAVKTSHRAKGVFRCAGAQLVQLLQLFVTVTALAIYYLIYCYMQLLYCAVRGAMYFHNADRAMKVTIAVVTATSLVVGFHLLSRFERLIGYKESTHTQCC